MTPATEVRLTEFDSPIGPLTVAAASGRVCLVHFGAADADVRRALSRWYPSAAPAADADPGGAVSALRAYFSGDVPAIDRVKVELHGTPFQQSVWQALRRIAHGRTMSYGELARAIGMPAAVRAVGAANGANPVAVIVPCHRVIGSSGTLTGYGGGLERKRWLLEHEGALQPLLVS
jgi:methylated-DNA-[protein]-cysteine S-methyltransferase